MIETKLSAGGKPARHGRRPALRHAALALAAVAALGLPPAAHAALIGTLYEGLGYDIETIGGNLAPVGFMSPTMSYVLPNSNTGGHDAGRLSGVGSAQYSTGTVFTGYRGIVMTATGSYALGTLGTNSVDGWTPVGFGSSVANGVADSGMIAGTSTLYSADGTQNFGSRPVWYAPGETTPNQLAWPASFVDSTGNGIGGISSVSRTGVIVGWGNYYKNGVSQGNRVLRWMSTDAQPELLQRLPGMSQWGGNNSSPVAVNASGTVIGEGNTFDSTGNLKGNCAIRWDAGTTAATPLGHLGTAADGTYATFGLAINDRGTAVGQSAKYDDTHAYVGDAAVRWPAKSSQPVELSSGLGVARDGTSFTYALGINDAELIYGIAQDYTPAGDPLGTRAVRWLPGKTTAQVLKPLSMALDGKTYTYAFGVNRKGWIAGVANAVMTDSSDTSNPYHLDVHAVVWGPDNSVHDLNDLLPPGSPWQLYGAYAISDSGLVTGIGFYTPAGYTKDYAYPRLYTMQLTKTADGE